MAGRRHWSISWLVACLAICSILGVGPRYGVAQDKPNIVLFYIDDLGYGDIGPFGATSYPTPNLDRMAREGRKFSDFIVASAVCSASRAALMTGCIHERVGIQGALGPDAKIGINAAETTLGEVCKQQGYATACFGKWHLGHHPVFLPRQHGFDRYLGLPYSNDMWPLHPDYVKLPPDIANRKAGYPSLPMWEDDQVIDSEVDGNDQKQLTRRYTEEAVRFIQSHAQEPFFVYVPHSMVHVPLFVSEAFDGKSGAGLFGDAMTEVDWSVGQVLQTLQELHLDKNTLVIFTSDNGPWLNYGNHAGSAGPLREGKGTAWEGGVRVPTLMWWPGKIPGGTECTQLASTIDLLPTIAKLLGAKLPEQPIDGKDISDLLFDKEGARSPHTSFPYYYSPHELRAVRDDRWKLMLPHQSRTLGGKPAGKDGVPGPYQQEKVELSLYDLDQDVGEQHNVANEYPAEVQRLLEQAEYWRTELGDSLTKRQGAKVRPAGRLQ